STCVSTSSRTARFILSRAPPWSSRAWGRCSTPETLKDVLLHLGSRFGLLLNLFGFFLDRLRYFLHDDLLDLLLKFLSSLPDLILDRFRPLLLDRFEHLRNYLLRPLFVDLLSDLNRLRFFCF